LRIQAEQAAANKDVEGANAVEEPEEIVDPNECNLRLRVDGKKKVHDFTLHADDPLSSVLEKLPGMSPKGGELQITCVAKRLVVKSTDREAMSKSLRNHGLTPNAAIVIKVSAAADGSVDASASKLADRAAAKKKIKKGTHTMQSIGIYSKDDNAKGELVDDGDGPVYEQDVSDDEEEQEVQDDVSEEPDDVEPGDSVVPDQAKDSESPSTAIERDE
jgi:hypothetical protein